MNPDFDIIAGPCSAESMEQVLDCAKQLSALGVRTLRAGVWKPRTRPGSFEGAGVQALDWLCEARRATGMKLAVEVAGPMHVEAAMKAGIDILWVGARTTVSPFAVQEIASALAGCKVRLMVKNPVNPDVDLWTGAIERFQLAGIAHISAIHRGFSSVQETVLRNAPQWEIPIELRRRMPDIPIYCDPSHMAGRSDLVPILAQMAMDFNANGLFVEVHPNPACALSDSTQQLTPAQFGRMVAGLNSCRPVAESDHEFLSPLRGELDQLDSSLIDILAKRMQVVGKIGSYKQQQGIAVLQPQRYSQIAENAVSEACGKGLDEKFVRSIFGTIHAESIRCQLKTKSNDKQ